MGKITLKQVAEILMGQSPKGNTYNKLGKGIPLLNGPTEFGSFHPTPALWTTAPTKICKKGDLLFCVRGSTTGRMNWADREYCIGRGIAAFHAQTDSMDTYYIYYTLVYELPNLLSLCVGSVFPNLSYGDFESLEINWPEKSTRSAIISTLKALDDKIELNTQMNTTFEAIGQAIFKHWFVDFEFPNEEGKPYKSSGGEMVDSELGEIPKGWTVPSFGEIVEVRGGSTPKTNTPNYWDGNIPWITPKDLTTSDRTHFSKTSRYITEAGLESISRNLLPIGSVLLTSRAPIGEVAINDVPMATNQGFINIICSDELNNLFLFYWLKFHEELLISFANGTTFLELSKSSFKKIKLKLPSKEIMQLFKTIISPMDLQITNNHAEIEIIAQVRDVLLPKLMSGEIRVLQKIEEGSSA